MKRARREEKKLTLLKFINHMQFLIFKKVLGFKSF